MGSDVIPADMWAGVFANQAFWFAAAFLAAGLLLKRNAKAEGVAVAASVALWFCALVANLALFALWYD